MSVWTHINGNIRIDCPVIVGHNDRTPKEKECDYLILAEEIKKLLGPQSINERNLEDEKKNEGEYLVPEGSEGTISYNVHPYIRYSDPCDSCPSGDCECLNIDISFGGDLRDFEKEDIRIAEHWFEKTIQRLNKKYFVRQAICQIECSDDKNCHFLYCGIGDAPYINHFKRTREF